MMIAARSQELDLIALTGDIVDFPSQANVDAVLAGVETAGVQTLYTAGNHDWMFPTNSVTVHQAELRETRWQALARLYEGEAAYEMRDIGGIRILTIDDSIYQITEAQLEFTRTALDTGYTDSHRDAYSFEYSHVAGSNTRKTGVSDSPCRSGLGPSRPSPGWSR